MLEGSKWPADVLCAPTQISFLLHLEGRVDQVIHLWRLLSLITHVLWLDSWILVGIITMLHRRIHPCICAISFWSSQSCTCALPHH